MKLLVTYKTKINAEASASKTHTRYRPIEGYAQVSIYTLSRQLH